MIFRNQPLRRTPSSQRPWRPSTNSSYSDSKEFTTSRPSKDGKKKRKSRLHDPWRIGAFYFMLALVFIRVSLIHEILTKQFGVNLYLLFIVGIPALVGVVSTGGLKRIFQFRPAVYWTCFALWLIPTTAFSTWRAGSLDLSVTYYRTDIVMLFAIGGLIMTWTECRLLMFTIAAASAFNLASVLFLGQKDLNDRTNLDVGFIGNSNDFAAHLILVMPFLFWIILTAKSVQLRILVSFALVFGIYQVLATASRGALLAMFAAVLTYLVSATRRQKKIAILILPVILITAFNVLPSAAVRRIFSFSETNSAESAEAQLSARIRERLLRDSILYTVQHPLFGLGPGQFNENEGKQRLPGEDVGLWFEAHNSFTQISSENGIPGFILFVGGILSSLLLLNKTGQQCRGKPDLAEIALAIICIRIALVGFCVAIFFLNFGYLFYLPTMAGIAIAVAGAASPSRISLTQNSKRDSRKGAKVKSWTWFTGRKRRRRDDGKRHSEEQIRAMLDI
jgi:hypothetical protein